MSRASNSGPRFVRHAGNVVTLLTSARQVMDARLSAEEAQARGSLATALEVGRMVPEKVLAFSACGAAIAQGAAELSQRAMDYGCAEMEAAHRAMLRAAASPTPMGWMAAQTEWLMGSMNRAASFGMGFSNAALGMAERSLRPVSRTVSGNLRRLR
ncbi:hypothetical protein E0493_03280 [Roseomonas sp. M0104]|uniref:Phasin family protein n=1 Tax=Teichococcus coralli TaxID=2545983 RepID=A0A845B6Q4_9PROT|nr:hypothetical protein [Pseudoroseomonas coralli]MXP62375.1 hypothetical protein [Pseudoroseomonas coralli]